MIAPAEKSLSTSEMLAGIARKRWASTERLGKMPFRARATKLELLVSAGLEGESNYLLLIGTQLLVLVLLCFGNGDVVR